MTQDEALAIMESGRSVLLTGAAGSGKTFLLRKFIRRARKEGTHVAVTATTGLAATHLNGITVHAWSGIGVQNAITKAFLKKLAKSRRDIIKKADVLIIDEISMLHDFRLDMVDEVLRHVRENEEPFGGLQVILCGDFFQLPPVNRVGERGGTFITNSQVWSKNVFTVCYLASQYRQRSGDQYHQILNGIREGVLTRSQLELLQSRAKAVDDPFTTRTRLLTTNADVYGVNERWLETLDGEVHEYPMETHGPKQFVEQLKKSCLAPETLRLKIGAQVMCIKNAQDKSYVNGSLGKVVAFEPLTDNPVVELNNGREITLHQDEWDLMDGEKRRASIVQYPLRLAWAITVHKSQGMTLDAARIDLANAFVEGMGYVALSRVRGIEFLILDGLGAKALQVSKEARHIDAMLKKLSEMALDSHKSGDGLI